MMWAKQSTAATLILGPVLDSTGAEYTSAVIGDISISKNGGTLTALASAATLTHIANGQYTLVLTTGNTDTLGRAQFTCNKSTYQMPGIELMVMPATVFDALITNAAGGANGLLLSLASNQVDVGKWLGTAVSTPTVAGVPNVNTKTWNDLATVDLPLAPTTAGRKLDVSTGGEAGVDWANVGSPTTTLALTGTTIATTQKVDLETIKTNPVVNAGTVTFPTTATLASTTNITGGTVTTATNVTTVNGLAAGVITATSIAADAITDAKVASDVTIASVTGAVGSVTGAVGSVTGNVGGNVTGSVGSIATGGIAAASFAAGAIDASAIATDAIGSNEVSAAAVTKIQSGLATPTNITAGTITTVTNLTNAPTAGDLTATMKASVTTAATAATPTVTAGTVSDKTGYALTAAYDAAKTAAQAGDAMALTSGERTTFAAVIWASLTSGLTTVGSIGKWILDKLDAAVSTRGTYSGGNITGNLSGSVGSVSSPVDVATIQDSAIQSSTLDQTALDAIAHDVWDEPTSEHQTAGTTGKALTDAGGGSSLTVQEIVDGVWDEPQADHLTAGSTGAKLNSAAAAGDPLASPVPGSYAPGEAGYILGTNIPALPADVAALISPLTFYKHPTQFTAPNFDVTLKQGTDYVSGTGRLVSFTLGGIPDPTAVRWEFRQGRSVKYTFTGAYSASGSGWLISCPLTRTQLETVASGGYSHVFVSTHAGGVEQEIASGKLVVI